MTDTSTDPAVGVVGNQGGGRTDATSDRNDLKSKLNRYRLIGVIATFLIILFVMGITWHWTMTKGLGVAFTAFVIAFAMKRMTFTFGVADADGKKKKVSDYAKPASLVGILFLIATPFMSQETRNFIWALDKREQCLESSYAADNAADCELATQILIENNGEFGKLPENNAVPWFADNSVGLGDPTGTGRAPRPSTDSIRGYTCPNMSRLEKIPTGWTVDTTEEWYGRVVIDLFDKKGRKTTVTAHGLHVAVQFQLCVKFERDNGEDISLKWTEAP